MVVGFLVDIVGAGDGDAAGGLVLDCLLLLLCRRVVAFQIGHNFVHNRWQELLVYTVKDGLTEFALIEVRCCFDAGLYLLLNFLHVGVQHGGDKVIEAGKYTIYGFGDVFFVLLFLDVLLRWYAAGYAGVGV